MNESPGQPKSLRDPECLHLPSAPLHPRKVHSVSLITTGHLRLKAKSLLWTKPVGSFFSFPAWWPCCGNPSVQEACLPGKRGHGSAWASQCSVLIIVAHYEVLFRNSDTASIQSIMKCKRSSWENSRILYIRFSFIQSSYFSPPK